MMIVLLITTFIYILIYYLFLLLKKDFDYWERRDIPYIKPWNLVGNYGLYILQQKYSGMVAQLLFEKYPFAPYVGMFMGQNKNLFVQDPELIRRIMTKDFLYRNGRENSHYARKETFLNSPFFSAGDQWKLVRQNITPIYSSSKIKIMFAIIKPSVYAFEKNLDDEIRNGNVEVRSIVIRFNLDPTSNGLLGIGSKAFEKKWKNNPSVVVANKILINTSRIPGMKLIGKTMYRQIFYVLGIKDCPAAIVNFFKCYLRDFFKENQSVKKRRLKEVLTKMKTEKEITGDCIENIQAENTKEKLNIDDYLVLSQCVALFGAGFDSRATSTTFALYEIAKHPKVQKRAGKEIDDYLKRHDNKLLFDCFSELSYVNACIDEALRLYPVVANIRREIMEPYTLPCGAVLDKGVSIHIPAYHLHRSAKFFPNPEQFQPERFLGENKQKIQPYTYLPFGEGPRTCFGNHTAKMHMILAIVTVLKRFHLEMPDEMPQKLEVIPQSLLTQPTKKITLKLLDREGWQTRKFA